MYPKSEGHEDGRGERNTAVQWKEHTATEFCARGLSNQSTVLVAGTPRGGSLVGMGAATIAQGLSGQFAESLFQCRRFPTRTVSVGGVAVGGTNPIRLQSMTIADTMDTAAVVQEAIELFQAGAEIVRVTAPSKRDAENIGRIRAALNSRGYSFPLCADIHFAPQAAMVAVEHAEKVRINPGNFADSKRFKIREYTEAQYQEELDRIHDVFSPLVLRAKELGRAMRIGANHGSLSDRILNRHGDTPSGMVESALEFIRVAEVYDYHDIIVSMKASNPVVMVQAYRLLVERFRQEGMSYPLHLGVTEAGDGRDARIKSAVGIGSLLEDGIGDTIRVSLTEDSVHELLPARQIALRAQRGPECLQSDATIDAEYLRQVPAYSFARRNANGIRAPLLSGTGEGDRKDTGEAGSEQLPAPIRLAVQIKTDLRTAAEQKEKLDRLSRMGVDLALSPVGLAGALLEEQIPVGHAASSKGAAFCLVVADGDFGRPAFLAELEDTVRSIAEVAPAGAVLSLKKEAYAYARPPGTDLTHLYRLLFTIVRRLAQPDRFPILARIWCATEDEALYAAALHGGGLLLDGIVDGILVEVDELDEDSCARLGLDVLQSVRLRMSRAEFISCPSCGRTLFDLQETTARIKARTGHLKGVKIAIMGCIVNGPGEMADADFGYVGAGPGQVHLYREKDLIQPNVPHDRADEELVRLIKQHGMWQDP